MSSTAVETGTIRTKIPSRLDRLPWTRFHWLVVLGLGTAWILDGLEVTIVGTIASRMTEPGSGITISVAQIGIAGSVYVAGACLGALFFGQLTDRFGRKKLFMWTLGLYLVATAATGLSFSPWYFFIARFFTGAAIGGEYSAINSAIDELIPARARGRVDLIINGSYWIGSAAGSAATIALLNTAWLPKDIGWRIGFALGVVLAIAVLVVRRHVPESPRWLFIHGREEEAEAIVAAIEQGIEEETHQSLPPVSRVLTVRQRTTIPFREIARVGFKVYPRRSVLALALFVGQAFIYNGITFNLGTLMTTFFRVSSGAVPIFIILYAVANFAGPLTIGRLFDTVGRKPMISSTYLASAAIGIVLAVLFAGGALNKWTFIAIVMATFFLASAGASAAYLTASEIFPMETRALAIAFFYAIGTAVGGISGPLLFGSLIGSGKASQVAIAFYIGSGVMALGGIAEITLGIKAERRQLEDVARPLTVADAESGEQGHPDGQGGIDEARRASMRAAEERARSADHLAAMHLARANVSAGEPSASNRAHDEEVLARVADLAAQALDEESIAAQEAAAGPDGATARVGQHRADAARSRAAALRNQARALASESSAEASRLEALAEAGRERALASEQRAEAELADSPPGGSGDGRAAGDRHVAADGHADGSGAGEPTDSEAGLRQARQTVHEMWARLHEARARAAEARANGQDEQEAAREAEAALERARAAEAQLEAAGHREDAREARVAEEAAQDLARERDERRRLAARDERIRARLERRRASERGLRRLRPGPGRAVSGSPAISSMAPPPELLDHEIAAIARLLAERGPLGRDEMRDLLGARYWGPGVFARALAEAMADGDVRRVGRDSYDATGAGSEN